MRRLSYTMKLMKRFTSATTLLMLLTGVGATAIAEVPLVSIAPDTSVVPGDTFVVMIVQASGPFTTATNNGLKGIHMVIGFSSSIVEPDTTDGAFQPIEPGALFPTGDSVTFIWDYYSGTTGELTADIFFLPDTQTIEGPGTLLRFQMNTKNFGTTQVKFLDIKLRDNLNRSIPHQTDGAWIIVCHLPGDVNADNKVDPVDVAYLVDYLFLGGPPPLPIQSGDVNCDGLWSDPVDLAVFVDYFYQGGEICTECL